MPHTATADKSYLVNTLQIPAPSTPKTPATPTLLTTLGEWEFISRALCRHWQRLHALPGEGPDSLQLLIDDLLTHPIIRQMDAGCVFLSTESVWKSTSVHKAVNWPNFRVTREAALAEFVSRWPSPFTYAGKLHATDETPPFSLPADEYVWAALRLHDMHFQIRDTKPDEEKGGWLSPVRSGAAVEIAPGNRPCRVWH